MTTATMTPAPETVVQAMPQEHAVLRDPVAFADWFWRVVMENDVLAETFYPATPQLRTVRDEAFRLLERGGAEPATAKALVRLAWDGALAIETDRAIQEFRLGVLVEQFRRGFLTVVEQADASRAALEADTDRTAELAQMQAQLAAATPDDD